jgi:hypothetical protein
MKQCKDCKGCEANAYDFGTEITQIDYSELSKDDVETLNKRITEHIGR